MKKQTIHTLTAVEWLWNEIDNLIPYQDINKAQQFNELLEKAKEIEKEQIMDAYENGVSDENESNLSGLFTNAEQYYNQTFKK